MTEPTWSQISLFVGVLIVGTAYFASMALAQVAYQVLGYFGKKELGSRLVSWLMDSQEWLVFVLVVLAAAYFLALAFNL